MPTYDYYIPQNVASRVDLDSPLIHRFDREQGVIAPFSTATFANASGDRYIDYDPDRTSATGLIGPFAAGVLATTRIGGHIFGQIETSRKNEALNSGTPIANWGATRASWGLTPDYLGGVMGNLIEDNTATDNHRCEEGTVSFDGTSEYCISFYAKGKERTGFQTYGTTGAFPSGVTANFRLTGAGTVLATGAGTNDAGIYLVKDGTYRCWMTATSDAAATSRWECRMLDGAGNVTYNGDNASGMWFWGATYEVGSFPSSYIPTVGAGVTRAKDQLYWPSADVPAALRGKITFQWIPGFDSTTGGTWWLWDFDSSGASERHLMRYLGGNDKITVYNNDTTTEMVASNALTFAARDKLTVTVDPAEGSVEVTGASGGDGKNTGTGWATTAGNVWAGMSRVASFQTSGLISEPYKA